MKWAWGIPNAAAIDTENNKRQIRLFGGRADQSHTDMVKKWRTRCGTIILYRDSPVQHPAECEQSSLRMATPETKLTNILQSIIYLKIRHFQNQ